MVSLYACRRLRIWSVIRVKNLYKRSRSPVISLTERRTEEPTREESSRGYVDMPHAAEDFGSRR